MQYFKILGYFEKYFINFDICRCNFTNFKYRKYFLSIFQSIKNKNNIFLLTLVEEDIVLLILAAQSNNLLNFTNNNILFY